MDQAHALWEEALGYLRTELNEIQYNTWIKALVPQLVHDGTFYLLSPNEFHQEHTSQYIPLIKNTLQAISREPYEVKIILDKAELPQTEAHTKPSAMDVSGDQLLPLEQDEATGVGGVSYTTKSKLNSDYTFDSFVLGGSNRLAHAACVAVAENQGGRSFNPLFIYGGSGLGKTHLMHAIGNYSLDHSPERKIIYVQSEQFVNEFIYTIRKKTYDEFRLKYRHCDLLLIDDIQFIEGKEQMQVEFFHTFNELYENGANIVMTCDKPPQSLNWLEERLRTRFSSGLLVDIQPPDYETRVAILENLASGHHSDISDEVIDYIATHISSNIRELEGAFNTVMAYASLSGSLDLDLAKKALKDFITPQTKRQVNTQVILEVVARFYNLEVDDLLSKARSRDISYPRQIAMYLCREILGMTYADIGKDIGGRDHSTVIHAWQKITDDLKEDRALQEEIKQIRKRVEL